jgi:ComF family protein
MNTRFERWSQAAMRALLPCSCALCHAPSDAPVCAGCAAAYVAPRRPRCPRCANPCAARDACRPCGVCQSGRPAYDVTVAAADYAAPLDQLVLQLKFGAALALAPWLADALKQVLTGGVRVPLPNLICPVPLSAARLQQRGYNQALEIARPLARSLGIPLHARLAIRAIDTPAQSGVSPGERQRNIRNAFIVAPDALALVRGQHIGVVDDVMTSGHTLDELAATFKRFGAARVTNLVFARTPPH